MARANNYRSDRVASAEFFHCTSIFTAPALCLALVLGTQVHPAGAAVTEAWVRHYSNVVSNSVDQAFKVVCDAAGNIIVVGYTDGNIVGPDMLTIKYSGANGSVIWQTRYNGPDNGRDGASAVAVDFSGNVVVTGYSGSGTNSDYYTAKYATASGTLLWEKRYNGPANSDDGASAVAVDGSGNAIVTGYSRNRGGDYDYYTAKYAAASGGLLWEQRYNSAANNFDRAKAVVVDGSGNVVVTGYSSNGGGNTDYCTIKYAAADGALLWEKHDYGGGQAVVVDGAGNAVVTGQSRVPVNPPYPGFPNYSPRDYTAKYAAADGRLLWSQSFGPPDSVDYANGVAVDASGNVIVTGTWYGGDTFDYYTAKYAATDGAILWERRYDGPTGYGQFDEDEALAVAVDTGGNVVVTGRSNDTGQYFDNDFYTAKYAAADGALLWEKRYTGPVSGNDTARSVAVDGTGNVVVTGFSSDDYYTAKYAAASGMLLWESRYNGIANNDDYASAVAVDDSGNVVVTGNSYTGNSDDNKYTAKYAAGNGALLWEKRSHGGGGAVAVDGNGNVVVIGLSWNGSNYDFYTAKYAAANGTLLWEQRYNGPANSHDGASAVVVDDTGNVLVSGYSGNGTNSDYYTAKYASANGMLLWEKRYNGPANSDDGASAVAVDGGGNVLVTGSSKNGTNSDYYTAKYATASGTLLWEKRYNGPANLYDRPAALALDSKGNVVVTGTSSTSNGTSDVYTAKYAASDGVLLWENRSLGGGSAVAVDNSDNVVVTGTVWNGRNYDYYTAKYAAMDGSLLWEKHYSGSADGDDHAQRLALGPDGMVAITGFSDGAFGPAEIFNFATIVYQEPLPPLFIALVPAGVHLRFAGDTGRSYTIQRAPAVTGPWSLLAGPISFPGGQFEFVDTNRPPGSAFYRTRTP